MHLLTIEDDYTLISIIYEMTDGDIYYTEWDEDDHQYAVDSEGNVTELELN